MSRIIYKITERDAWALAQESGSFDGSPVDLQDGFIHFSTATQVKETAAKHFAGQTNLVLLAIDSLCLDQDALRYEPSRGGALFPHLYGPLPVHAVVGETPLDLGTDGIHIFPELQ
ncbi:DUF952 domain-containing protein [Limoniibacter endophyticus]|uniref:Dihydroorotate dehydrogenase n=1 Tax=Limoniibacter endophyticus TaxID=1565040 RepID=A0A8J3DLB1_9HYPH|nr:DUF952 domain-containing protein [Limoniibacter endophyticus]GHC80169.1 dihydroorotate dehydrogenase [Limoniibacter endophyticus]